MMNLDWLLPTIGVGYDMFSGGDSAPRLSVVVEKKEPRPVTSRRFDLEDVRGDLLYDLIPVHSITSSVKMHNFDIGSSLAA